MVWSSQRARDLDNSALGSTKLDNGPRHGPRSCQALDKGTEGTVAIEKCGPPRTDNLQESEISGVLLQARYQLAKAWLENNPYPFPMPSLPSCSFSAANPQPGEQTPGKGCFSKTHRDLDHKDLLRTCHVDSKCYRTVWFCCGGNFHVPPSPPPYLPVSATINSC